MAWAVSAHTAKTATASNTITTTAIDTTGATVLVIFAGGLLAATLTDSMSNTNIIEVPRLPSASGYGMRCFIIVNPLTNASHTFTYAATNAFPSLAVLALTGAYGGPELTKGLRNASAQTIAPGSITPTSDNAILVTGYNDSQTSGTRSISGGFTIDDSLSGTANGDAMATAHLIQTSAAAANPTWTTTAAATNILSIMVSLLLRPSGSVAAAAVYGSS